MSIIGLGMNLILAILLGCALVMGWRLNGRLKALRDSHQGFAVAVHELNTAAARAEQGLAALRAATDEAAEVLGDRIEKARVLSQQLETLTGVAAIPAAPAVEERGRLGPLIAAARQPRPERPRRELTPTRPRLSLEEELFEDEPVRPALNALPGGRR